MEKVFKHTVKPLNGKELKVISGGYAPNPPHFNPMGNDNIAPDYEMPTKEDFKFY